MTFGVANHPSEPCITYPKAGRSIHRTFLHQNHNIIRLNPTMPTHNHRDTGWEVQVSELWMSKIPNRRRRLLQQGWIQTVLRSMEECLLLWPGGTWVGDHLTGYGSVRGDDAFEEEADMESCCRTSVSNGWVPTFLSLATVSQRLSSTQRLARSLPLPSSLTYTTKMSSRSSSMHVQVSFGFVRYIYCSGQHAEFRNL